MSEFQDFWKRGLDFKGVSTVKEYWMAYLFNFLISFALSMIVFAGFMSEIDSEEVTITILCSIPLIIYGLASLIPNIAITVRRLHDTNKNGLYLLFALIPYVGGIVIFVFTVLGSDYANNQYIYNDMDWRERNGKQIIAQQPMQYQQPVQQQPMQYQQPVQQQPMQYQQPVQQQPMQYQQPVQQPMQYQQPVQQQPMQYQQPVQQQPMQYQQPVQQQPVQYQEPQQDMSIETRYEQFLQTQDPVQLSEQQGTTNLNVEEQPMPATENEVTASLDGKIFEPALVEPVVQQEKTFYQNYSDEEKIPQEHLGDNKSEE